MNIPRFTAESSLYKGNGSYRTGSFTKALGSIQPAQFDFGGDFLGAPLVCDVCDTICEAMCEFRPNPDRCYNRCRQRRCPQC